MSCVPLPRKVAEVLAKVDNILLTDSSISYINKRVHTALCLHRVISTLATNILLTNACTLRLTC